MFEFPSIRLLGYRIPGIRLSGYLARSPPVLSPYVAHPIFRPVCRACVSPGLPPVFHDRSLGPFSARSVELVCHPVFRRSFTIGHSACFPPGLSNTYSPGFPPGLSNAFLTRSFAGLFTYFLIGRNGEISPLRTQTINQSINQFQTCNLMIEPVSRALLSLRNSHNRNYSDRLRSYYNSGAPPCQIGYLVWHPRVIV